jgi:exoribonuclease R
LGPIGDLNVETEALLLENQIVNTPFSQQAIAELPADWHADNKGRRDLRKSHMVIYIYYLYNNMIKGV